MLTKTTKNNNRLCFSLIYFFAFSTLFAFNKVDKLINHKRVKQAYRNKNEIVQKLLAEKNLKTDKLNIFIIVFKQQQLFEIWGRNNSISEFCLIKGYNFEGFSGKLGPKRREGYLQIPEGVYYIVLVQKVDFDCNFYPLPTAALRSAYRSSFG